MMTDSKSNIQIKGVRDGLLVSVGEGNWTEIQVAILAHIVERAAFFKGARLALDVGSRIVHAAELSTLRDRLSDQGVALWAVLSSSTVTEQTSQTLGLATRIHTPRPERSIKSQDTELTGDGAILVRRTIRSGFRVASRGHVLVVGDINPGGEIEAGGSVVVWGKLRGSVQAGSNDPENSVICALEMSPTLLQIGETIISLPAAKSKQRLPQMARLQNGQVIFETWDIKEK